MTSDDSAPPHSPPPANPPPPVVDHLTGRGRVLRVGAPVLEIDYDITITSLPADAELAGPAAPDRAIAMSAGAGEHLDITGRLLGPFFTGERLPGVHTLVLEDGRAFDFRVIQPDTNEIAAVSALRPAADRRTKTTGSGR